MISVINVNLLNQVLMNVILIKTKHHFLEFHDLSHTVIKWAGKISKLGKMYLSILVLVSMQFHQRRIIVFTIFLWNV